jgi:hypothetical protein
MVKIKKEVVKREEDNIPEFGEPYEKREAFKVWFRRGSASRPGWNLNRFAGIVADKAQDTGKHEGWWCIIEEWVNICFKERMEQILTDPREFGKIIINPIRRGYCLPEVDIH